jgi:hypothetical protein
MRFIAFVLKLQGFVYCTDKPSQLIYNRFLLMKNPIIVCTKGLSLK